MSACVAQLVEHFLGKEEVTGSIPVASSKEKIKSDDYSREHPSEEVEVIPTNRDRKPEEKENRNRDRQIIITLRSVQ